MPKVATHAAAQMTEMAATTQDAIPWEARQLLSVPHQFPFFAADEYCTDLLATFSAGDIDAESAGAKSEVSD